MDQKSILFYLYFCSISIFLTGVVDFAINAAGLHNFMTFLLFGFILIILTYKSKKNDFLHWSISVIAVLYFILELVNFLIWKFYPTNPFFVAYYFFFGLIILIEVINIKKKSIRFNLAKSDLLKILLFCTLSIALGYYIHFK